MFNLHSKTNERPNTFDGIVAARYRFAAKFAKGKKVLDVGSGLGAGANHLAQAGANKVLGIDYSKAAINHAKKSFVCPNLEFKVFDAVNLQTLNQRFDVITAFELIEHLPSGTYSKFIAQVKELLNPDGIAIISTPNKLISSPNRDKPYNPYHTKEFTPEELKHLVRAYFPNTTLLGVRCQNAEFLEKNDLAKKTLGNRLATLLSQHKIIHQLLPLVPKRIRWKVSSQDSLPILKADDFEISENGIKAYEGLLAVCRKQNA